jgi:hypothetical protein
MELLTGSNNARCRARAIQIPNDMETISHRISLQNEWVQVMNEFQCGSAIGDISILLSHVMFRSTNSRPVAQGWRDRLMGISVFSVLTGRGLASCRPSLRREQYT